MEKEQSRLKVLTEIRKDRVATYPYFIVANTYSAHDHHFIVAADYRGETAELSIYPFRNDMSRLTTSTLILTEILPRKVIATIHVNSIIFKSNSTSITISQAEFILGYRTGHLLVVQYKDRDFKVKQRLNRGLKGEGFLSRASSAIFGGEETYTPYFKAPIRSFRLYPFTPDLYHIWQVGNSIILQRELSEDRQNKFFSKHESMDFDNFYLNYDINAIIKEGEYHCYGCDYYSVLENAENRIALIAFRDEVNSYVNLPQKQELIVGLASKEEILVLDHGHFVLKGVIKLQIPLRNLTNFSSEGQDFLILMPYQNYIILYSLTNNDYCKLKGHKSFVANATFTPKDTKLISAGMDHRICFMNIKNITAANWIPVAQQSSKNRKIKEFDVPQQKFQDIYHIGQYNNNRSNLSSYGYGSLFELNGHYCLATYDGKIMVYLLRQ